MHKNILFLFVPCGILNVNNLRFPAEVSDCGLYLFHGYKQSVRKSSLQGITQSKGGNNKRNKYNLSNHFNVISILIHRHLIKVAGCVCIIEMKIHTSWE